MWAFCVKFDRNSIKCGMWLKMLSWKCKMSFKLTVLEVFKSYSLRLLLRFVVIVNIATVG